MKFVSTSKLPSLDPEIKDAIRKHIIKKRQRLKQELEQEAIMERMKKEREQKRVQDAMTLDQIKDQLSNLERKLETLRNEKHTLFVQLKQVLNENNSKRSNCEAKPTESSEPSRDAKKPRLEQDSRDDNSSRKAKEMQPESSNKSISSSHNQTFTSGLASNSIPNHSVISRRGNVIQPVLPLPSLQAKSKSSHSHDRFKSSSLRISENQNSNLFTTRLAAIDLDHHRALPMAHRNRRNLINLTENHSSLTSPVISNNLASLQSLTRGQPKGVDGYFSSHLPPDHLIGARGTSSFGYPFETVESRLNLMPLYTSRDTGGDIGRRQMHLKLLSQNDVSGTNAHQANNASNLNASDGQQLDLKKGHDMIAPTYPNQFALDVSTSGFFSHSGPLDQAALMSSISDGQFASGHYNLCSTNTSSYQNPRKPLVNRNTPRSSGDSPPRCIKSEIPPSGPGSQYASGYQLCALMPPASVYGQEGKMNLKQHQAQHISLPNSGISMTQHRQLIHQEQIPSMFHRASSGDVYDQSSPQKTFRFK